MAGAQYTEAVGVVPPIAMSLLLLFYAQLFINMEFYYEEKRALVAASAGAAVVNIVLNALLIPHFSFVAAGYTTLASYMLFAACNYVAMKRMLRRRGLPNCAYNMRALLLILGLFLLSGVLGMALYRYLIPRIVITVAVFICLVINRSRLINVLKTIKTKSPDTSGNNEQTNGDV